jgi:putative methionine-R-sulfoxide reductase with GAF domain
MHTLLLRTCSTQSEVVIPVVAPQAAAAAAAAGSTAGQPAAVSQTVPDQVQPKGRLLAVLDVDSDHPAAFDAVDARHLEELCSWLAVEYAGAAAVTL